MIIGQTLLKGVVAYSPWFPREGNAATFVLQVIGISGASLTISILQKNYEDTDSAEELAAAFGGVTATGTYTERGTSLKELLRCEYAVAGTNNYDWVHFRMLRPNWEGNTSSAAAAGAAGVA